MEIVNGKGRKEIYMVYLGSIDNGIHEQWDPQTMGVGALTLL